MASYRIFVGKDVHKFSSAHMTVFPDGTKERIHGHNFQVCVALELTDVRAEKLIDFGVLKKALVDQCAAWDQRLLLAAKSPRFKLVRDAGDSIEFELCSKRYALPRDEVLLLPIDNAVVETLADAFARALLAQIRPIFQGVVSAFEVTVTESENQGGTCRLSGNELV